MRKESIPELIAEIKDELILLDSLVSEVRETSEKIPESQKEKRIYEESLALKLHNYYTGCERIFRKIADDINGGVPVSIDWHKRLLRSISLEIEGIRPPVVSRETANTLAEYLAFRHVLRNIYGFEIDSERLKRLIENLYETYKEFRREVEQFLIFLRDMFEGGNYSA